MRVIDNCLKLDFKLEETNCYKTLPTYNFWNGWWNEKPRNYIEQVLELLWKDFVDVDYYKNGGFEYWNRPVYKGQTGLEWHQDDISDHEREQNYQIADISCIYYPKVSSNCVGGFLEIAPYSKRGTLKESIKATQIIDIFNVERIKPKTNRCVLFDSAQLHRISPVYQGYRWNLASTLWKTKLERFDDCENLNFNGSSCDAVDWEYKYEKNIKK